MISTTLDIYIIYHKFIIIHSKIKTEWLIQFLIYFGPNTTLIKYFSSIKIKIFLIIIYKNNWIKNIIVFDNYLLYYNYY